MVAARFAGLALERADLALDLAHDVADPNEVGLGVFQFAQSLFFLGLELGDASGLLEYRPPILRPAAQDQVDLALFHDRVTAAPDSGVHEQLMDVTQPASGLVEQILPFAVAENATRHTHLLVIRAQMLGTTTERQRNFRHAHRRTRIRPAKNDVSHFAAAQSFGRLLAETPANGVEDVRLAAPIRTNHRSDTFVKFQVRLVDERLKTYQFKRFEIHGENAANSIL